MIKTFVFLTVFSARAYAREIKLDLPKSEVSFSQNQKEAQGPHSFIEVHLSSWNPSQLEEPSNLENTSAFSSSTVPKLNVGLVIHHWPIKWGNLFLKAGGSYVKVQRQGYLRLEPQSLSRSQDLNCFEAQISTEWVNSNFYVEGGILPVWLQAPSSVFGGGISRILWAAKASGGFSFKVQTMDLLLGLENVHGLSEAQYSGLGLTLGARLSW